MDEVQTPTPELTPQAQHIYNMLRESGVWIRRAELARKLGKSMLNKWDIALLAKLTDAGLIESRKIPHHGPIGYEWQYRVSDDLKRRE